ncbi:uncharacterized protein PHACADRAFT_182373, partial [Phanerochaete carnosa HHB-10118-sp]
MSSKGRARLIRYSSFGVLNGSLQSMCLLPSAAASPGPTIPPARTTPSFAARQADTPMSSTSRTSSEASGPSTASVSRLPSQILAPSTSHGTKAVRDGNVHTFVADGLTINLADVDVDHPSADVPACESLPTLLASAFGDRSSCSDRPSRPWPTLTGHDLMAIFPAPVTRPPTDACDVIFRKQIHDFLMGTPEDLRRDFRPSQLQPTGDRSERLELSANAGSQRAPLRRADLSVVSTPPQPPPPPPPGHDRHHSQPPQPHDLAPRTHLPARPHPLPPLVSTPRGPTHPRQDNAGPAMRLYNSDPASVRSASPAAPPSAAAAATAAVSRRPPNAERPPAYASPAQPAAHTGVHARAGGDSSPPALLSWHPAERSSPPSLGHGTSPPLQPVPTTASASAAAAAPAAALAPAPAPQAPPPAPPPGATRPKITLIQCNPQNAHPHNPPLTTVPLDLGGRDAYVRERETEARERAREAAPARAPDTREQEGAAADGWAHRQEPQQQHGQEPPATHEGYIPRLRAPKKPAGAKTARYRTAGRCTTARSLLSPSHTRAGVVRRTTRSSTSPGQNNTSRGRCPALPPSVRCLLAASQAPQPWPATLLNGPIYRVFLRRFSNE